MIKIISKQNSIPTDGIVIDTTSHSHTWSKGLSPFYLGPVEICEGLYAKNVENAWQFSKIYKNHFDENGFIKVKEYINWAIKGFEDSFAHRYPMGKGAKAEFSVNIFKFGTYTDSDGIKTADYCPGAKHFSYIEARKELYIPFYSKTVRESEAYMKLEDIFFNERKDIYLVDFDGYDHKALGRSYQEVVDDPDRKMGHAFVLGMMLEGLI